MRALLIPVVMLVLTAGCARPSGIESTPSTPTLPHAGFSGQGVEVRWYSGGISRNVTLGTCIDTPFEIVGRLLPADVGVTNVVEPDEGGQAHLNYTLTPASESFGPAGGTVNGTLTVCGQSEGTGGLTLKVETNVSVPTTQDGTIFNVVRA